MFPIKHLQFVTSCPPVKNAVSAHCSESSLLPHYQPLRWTKKCTAPRQHEKLPLPFAAEWKLHPSPSFFPSSSPVFHMFPHFSHHFWCCPRLSPIRNCPQPPPAWSQHRLLPHLLLHQRRRRGRARQQRMGRGLGPVASKEEAQGVLDDGGVVFHGLNMKFNGDLMGITGVSWWFKGNYWCLMMISWELLAIEWWFHGNYWCLMVI